MTDLTIGPAEEGRHRPGPGRWWSETWCFEVVLGPQAGALAAITILPGRNQAWYWAGVVRPGAPLVVLHDLGLRLPARRLEIRGEALWADHINEEPFEHWTIGNEAYALAVDDADEVLGRGRGESCPLGFDLEWERAGAVVADEAGYAVPAAVHGEILIGSERLVVAASGRWWHRWGAGDWFEPSVRARPVGPRLPVPLRIEDPVEFGGPCRADLDHVLTTTGWVSWTSVPAGAG
jgi:hypothetical protein